LLACAQVLANPGAPLRFEYQTPGGVLTITAESYSINTKTGDLMVLRPRVVDPHGNVLVYAARVDAMGLPLLNNESRRAVVHVRDAFATIQRGRDGKLELLSYLPEKKESTSEFPFAVDLDRAQLKYVDTSGPEKYVQQVEVTDLNVDGVGDKWIGSANAFLANVGKLRASLQNVPGEGLWVKGDTGRLELAPAFRAFRAMPEGQKEPLLQDFDAESLIVQGPFELLIPTDQSARLKTRLVAEAKGFRYGTDYRAETAKFDGLIDAQGASGTLVAENRGLSATYDGFVRWDDGTRLKGALKAKAVGVDSLPPLLSKALPKEVHANGPIEYYGALAYSPENGVQLNGKASAGSLSAYEETLKQPRIDFSYARDNLTLITRDGTWRGSAINGSLALDTKAKTIRGKVQVKQVNLGDIAKRFGIERFSGRGDLVAAVEGTVDNPTAYFRTDTEAIYAVRKDLPGTSGRLHLAGTLKNRVVDLDQAYLISRAGSISATGTYDLDKKLLDGKVVASGIDLYRIDPQLEGIGRMQAKVGGTLPEPHYSGSAELFGLRIQEEPVPILTTDFSGNFKQVRAENIKVVKGASQAQGSLALTFKNMGLDGSFQALGVQLSDFLGDDYLASISLPDATVSGTLGTPKFTSSASAGDIVIKGTRIDSAQAQITYANGLLEVDDFNATVGTGDVQAYLSYEVDKKTGQASLTAQNIDLGDVIPPDLGATMTGTVSGEFGLTFDGKGLVQGSGEGKLNEVEVNATPFGNGIWKVSGTDANVKGSLQVGLLERSIEVNNFGYQPDTRGISGEVLVRNAQFQDLYNVSKPYLPSLSEEVKDILARTSMKIGLAVDLGGTLDMPEFANGYLALDSMTMSRVAGATSEDNIVPAGQINGQFSRQGKTWNLESLKWEGGPGLLEFSGAVEESGPIAITGRVDQFDVNFASLFDPELAGIHGLISLPLIDVSGETKSPVIRASALTTPGNGLRLSEDGSGEFGQLNVNLPEITLSEWTGSSGGLSVFGDVNIGGYVGRVSADVPFSYPFTILDGEPIRADVQLVNRSVGSIDQLASIFDPAKSKGEVSGSLSISGTKSDLHLFGGFGLTAEKLALKDSGAQFSDVRFTADLSKGDQVDGTLLRVATHGKSDRGGSFQGDISAQLPSFMNVLSRISRGQTENLLGSDLSGQFTAQRLAAEIPIGEDGRVSGEIDGKLAVGGTLRDPSLSGPLTLADAYIKMPSELEAGSQGTLPSYSPTMNISVSTKGPAKFKSSSAEIDLTGNGTIVGNFQDLDVNAQLQVTQGLLKLPTARVTLEPGGTIRPLFQIKNGQSEARLDVNMEGRTRVVAAEFGQSAQRYDVSLGITGDFLEDGGLVLTATSDPPELSQEKILALLGQVNLIEGLASGVQGGNAEKQLRNAFFGVAVPYLLDPLTSKIAGVIGLDYLTLDINPLEGATVYFARTLGKNFVVQGSRQISQIDVGIPVKYDLKLIYQLRFGRGMERRRLNFSIGTDEVRPWKLGIEFGFRF